ncbi:MAG: hypothetical protein JO256_08320, partial [Alphaproteobacteria bacterium]|nr:hypothetical protein [Alphaproteobacteria bacterium]
MDEEADILGARAGTHTTGADSAALALGLNAASNEKANAFLDDQHRLIEDQRRVLLLRAHEMATEEPYKLSHLRLRRFSDYAKAAFEFSAGLMALAVVGGLGLMVWNAAHADGLIVESFTVPPAMAEKGLGGQAIASQLLDKLTQIQRDTASVRPSKSYAGNWGDDLKVDIPETGISVGEVYRFLRGWLGHETRVAGEVYNSDEGIAITTRISGADSVTYSGPVGTLDSLLLQSAEHVYRATQPDRYARYLYINANTGGPQRFDEARSLLNGLIATSPPRERASALHQLGVLDSLLGDIATALQDYHRAITLDASRTITFSNLAGVEEGTGMAEAALEAGKSCVRLMERGSDPEIAPSETVRIRLGCQLRVALQQGDFAAFPGLVEAAATAPGVQGLGGMQETLPVALARQHDSTAASAALESLAPP